MFITSRVGKEWCIASPENAWNCPWISQGRDTIFLRPYSHFQFPLVAPGVCQLSQTSSDAILAPTTGVLARKPEIKLQPGLYQLVRRACSFSSNITILFRTLLSPTAKFFPSYQLDSPSPTAIQTFCNLHLTPYVLVCRPLPVLFKLTCFLHSGALGKVAVPARLPLPHNMHSIAEFKMGFMHFSQLIQSFPCIFCSVFKTHVGRQYSWFPLLITGHLLSVPEARMGGR